MKTVMTSIAAAALLLFATGAASAQQPIRGQVEKMDASGFVLKTREGSTINVTTNDATRITALAKASIGDIKPDTYVGIAGVPRPDGSIEAFSIHIPPAALRGNNEGERTWNARPGSTMINTYFGSAVVSGDGHLVTVRNKDGEKKVIVTAATGIAMAVPAEKGELKAGSQIIILGSENQADGTVLAKSMYVGRNLTPAM